MVLSTTVFPPAFGPTHDHRSLAIFEPGAERDREACLLLQEVLQEWVARLVQYDSGTLPGSETRHAAAEVDREPRPREHVFQLSDCRHRLPDVGPLGMEPGAHLTQDSENLGLLVLAQPHETVVLDDGVERFDEDGLATGTRPVHDPVDPALQCRLDRYDRAAVAHRDVLVLQHSGIRMFADESLQ